MKFINLSQKKILPSLISVFLILSFTLVPLSHTFEVKKVEAQEIVYDPTNWVANWGTYIESAISAVADSETAAALGAMVTKEYILDNLVWPLINIALQEMIRSTTQWVRSGFQGSPAFVTDLEGFLLNVADVAAGNYIWGSPLSFICSPFSLNVRLALHLQYKSTKLIAQCRLSTALGNVNSFLNGNFMAGGWNAWYDIALVPSNNVYGSTFLAQSGLYANLTNARGQQLDLLKMGNGFFSRLGIDGNIIAPGKVIQEELNHTLGLAGDRLVVADELNELVGALFSQIALQALSGAGGLLGLDSPYQYQGNAYDSYYSAVAAQNAAAIPGTQGGNPTIEASLNTERRFLTLQTTIVNLITDASTYKDRVHGVNDSCDSGALTSSLANQLSSAQQQVAVSGSVVNTLSVFLSDFTALQNVNTPQTTINALLAKYNATSITAAQSSIMRQYLQFQSTGVLHLSTDIVTLELRTIPDLRTEVKNFTDSIDDECDNSNDND